MSKEINHPEEARDMVEPCLHEFVPFQSGCAKCGEQYAATPSEDGREVPEVVGVRISSDGFGSYIADSAMGVGVLYPGDMREPLMTVAQHSLIVAAKDAEISRLKDALLATAVACVMPERKSETAPPPFERGYNAALDEVARLNRNQIPVELLKQIEHQLELRAEFDPTYPPETHPLNDDAKLLLQLRALLANEEGAQ